MAVRVYFGVRDTTGHRCVCCCWSRRNVETWSLSMSGDLGHSYPQCQHPKNPCLSGHLPQPHCACLAGPLAPTSPSGRSVVLNARGDVLWDRQPLFGSPSPLRSHPLVLIPAGSRVPPVPRTPPCKGCLVIPQMPPSRCNGELSHL
jgi:hypothetical protein